MILDYDPGDKVTNPNNKEWGIGQVQSIINDKVTVNFENACLLYTSPSPRDATLSRMPSSA